MNKKINKSAYNTIHSLSDFIKQLETRINDRYRIILFRGQNLDKALIPRIARHYFKKSREIDERRMLNEFISNSISHLEYTPKNILEHLTIAQHHGVPTRLLDWTESALTALYFATCSTPPTNEKHVVLWSISLERDSELLLSDANTDPFEIDKIKIFKPANFIQRVASQHGWFSIHPSNNNGFYERAENITDDTARINKFIIPRDNVKGIHETLEVCGVNIYTIFQDLDSLGNYIFKKYTK